MRRIVGWLLTLMMVLPLTAFGFGGNSGAGGGSSFNPASPGAIGGTTPSTGTFTNINAVNAQGAIGSGGTLTCNMTSASICTASWSTGNITIAQPTGMVQNQVYYLFLSYTGSGFNSANYAASWLTSTTGGGADVALNSITSGGVASFWSIAFTYDGTSQRILPATPTLNAGTIHSGTFTSTSSGDTIGADNIVNSMARTAWYFDEGHETALTANESLGTFKTVKAVTIENIEADVKISPTCSVSEVITCFDCGTSAGACTAGQTATISTTTIATGATRQSVDQTVSTANVAAAHYVSCLITAGTCTVSDNAITMMVRPQ